MQERQMKTDLNLVSQFYGGSANYEGFSYKYIRTHNKRSIEYQRAEFEMEEVEGDTSSAGGKTFNLYTKGQAYQGVDLSTLKENEKNLYIEFRSFLEGYFLGKIDIQDNADSPDSSDPGEKSPPAKKKYTRADKS